MTALFIVSIVVFVLSMFAMLAFLGLWVYKDAQVKSDQSPAVWVLLVLFIPNLIGLIVYMLVGRTHKDLPAPGHYKKALIASVVTFGLAMGLFITSTVLFVVQEGNFGSHATWNSGVWSARTTNYRNGRWTENVRSGRGNSRRTHTLTYAQMQNFTVDSTNEEGYLFILLEQGDNASRIDITGDFYEAIDLVYGHGFSPGRLRMTLQYERVRNSRTVVCWRVE